MDTRPQVFVWSALAFMACAAPTAWLWELRPGWSRSDVLAVLQTTLSVLALGAALAIAVWEFLRTRRAEVRRREDLVRVARDLTEFVVKLTIELEKPEYFTQLTVAHGEDAEAHYKADVVNLKNQIRMTMDVVEALVPQVLEARLSLDLVNLKYAYKVGLSNYVLGDARVQSAEHRDVGLDALRRLREPLQELLAKLK